MKIVTSLYGNKYVSLLLVFLESINKNIDSGDHEVFVFWSDVDKNLLLPIKKAYPNTRLFQLESTRKIDDSSTANYFSSLKSGKMAYLNKVYSYLEEDEDFVLIDCDTIILTDISTVFKKQFEIAFTPLLTGNSKYPMNVGVLFLRNTVSIRELTKNMQIHINQIIEDEELHTNSFSKYGAADQAAFCRIIDFQSDGKIQDNLKVSNLNIIKLDWFQFNNFTSVESLKGISILHLKGSWQTILFKGRSLQSIKNKKDKASLVYLTFMQFFRSAIKRTYNPNDLRTLNRPLGLKIPFFIKFQSGNVEITKTFYQFYRYPERVYRYFFNRKIHLVSRFFEKFLFTNLKRII